jgi:hypothetical protein
VSLSPCSGMGKSCSGDETASVYSNDCLYMAGCCVNVLGRMQQCRSTIAVLFSTYMKSAWCLDIGLPIFMQVWFCSVK